MLKLRILTRPEDLVPPAEELAKAGGRGISNAVKRHLVARDEARPPKDAMPKSGYYGKAASGVTTDAHGNIAVVTVPKEGMALHYYGGVVYPTAGHKALAIPKVAATAGKRPADYDPDRSKLALVWPKGSKTGTLRSRDNGEVFYILVRKAKIEADKTVMPTDGELENAAIAAMEAIL